MQTNTTYHLGSASGYIYTGLGEFRTADAAVQRCNEPRAVVYARSDLRKHGVMYGSTGYVPVAVRL